jgi:Mor family transcriptional regulator
VKRPRTLVSDFLIRTRNRLVRELRQLTGQNEGDALRIASKVLEILCHESGGADVYIPLKPRRRSLGLVDEAAIVRDLQQLSVRAVARRHQLSKSAVQRIKARASGNANPQSAGLSTGTARR